jgi:nicotinamidase-related amidase
VLQTTLDLIANDFDVFLAADCVSSRASQSVSLALGRMARAGAALVNHEMVGFEWLERAGTPEFKDLIAVIK